MGVKQHYPACLGADPDSATLVFYPSAELTEADMRPRRNYRLSSFALEHMQSVGDPALAGAVDNLKKRAQQSEHAWRMFRMALEGYAMEQGIRIEETLTESGAVLLEEASL